MPCLFSPPAASSIERYILHMTKLDYSYRPTTARARNIQRKEDQSTQNRRRGSSKGHWVRRHNTCIHLQLDQIRLEYQMLGSTKGGHTCWVLIIGEGPHEDLAKWPTKTGALGVRRWWREDKEVRVGGGGPGLLATAAPSFFLNYMFHISVHKKYFLLFSKL